MDAVIRKPHKKTGEIVSKTKLISKPEWADNTSPFFARVLLN
jgi:hypothetical protein